MDSDQALMLKRTKIVATLGPASDNKETFTQMVRAGVNAVRLNFSHGDHTGHARIITLVRQVSAELNCPIAIIGDLRGPHIRVGDVENGQITLTEGQSIILTPEPCPGTPQRVSISYPKLALDVQRNTILLLDDGNIELKVTRILPDNSIEALITRGGPLSSRRGINVPGVKLSLPSLTQKDLADIDFAIANNLDFVALSFVQSAQDIKTLKTLLAANNSDIAVIAKIEMSSAVDDIEAIVAESDAVMVARGDLALEMSFRDVPIAQKRIIATCRKNAVPVITATQMFESMINAGKPTRAEVTDVANAIFDGTDAVMLSGETAIGHYPVETIATMSRIATRAEEAWCNKEVPHPLALTPERIAREIICYSSAMTAEHMQAVAIIAYSRTGGTARRISRYRPYAQLIALTPSAKTFNRLSLAWGIIPVLIDTLTSTETMICVAVQQTVALNIGNPGDYIVITSGNPARDPGNTNLITLEKITTDA